MVDSFTFGLMVVGVLMAYLCLSVWIRYRAMARADRARSRALDREYPGKGLDTSAIEPRISRVRRDYAASARQRPRPGHCRAELCAAARRLVTGLAYFRRVQQDPGLQERSVHTHEPSATASSR